MPGARGKLAILAGCDINWVLRHDLYAFTHSKSSIFLSGHVHFFAFEVGFDEYFSIEDVILSLNDSYIYI